MERLTKLHIEEDLKKTSELHLICCSFKRDQLKFKSVVTENWLKRCLKNFETHVMLKLIIYQFV